MKPNGALCGVVCLSLLGGGFTRAMAQTTVLEPFTVSGTLAVIDRNNVSRAVSGVDVMVTGTAPTGPLVSRAVFLAGLPPTYSVQLARVVGGLPIDYVFMGETQPLPTLLLQSGTRRVSEALPNLTSPNVGDTSRPIERIGLCPLTVTLTGARGRRFSGLDLVAEALDGSMQGQFSATVEAPAGTNPAEATGYILGSDSAGLPTITGELLLRGGRSYRLRGSVRVDEIDQGFVESAPASVDGTTCRWGSGGGSSSSLPLSLPPAAVLTGQARFRSDASDPDPPVFSQLVTRARFPTGDLLREWNAQVTGDFATFGSGLATGTWLLSSTATFDWPDGRSEVLTLPSSAQFWTPRLTLPLLPGPVPAGLYPDTSVVLQADERADLRYDVTLGVIHGDIALSGCATASSLREGSARFVGTVQGSATFTDETGAVRPAPNATEGGSARTLVHPGTARYVAAVPPGPWRLGELAVGLRPPPSEGDSTLLRVEMSALPAYQVVAAGTSSTQRVSQSLAVGSLKVRLVVRNADGSFRPFQSASARIDAHPAVAADGTLLGRYWSSSSARGGAALSHTIHLFALPGQVTVLASALVPANPDGTGPMSVTSFPPIVNVPVRPPRADGSCAGICADTTDGVYWNDDLRGPTITFDPYPAETTEGLLRLTGSVSDEAPVDALSVEGTSATLDGLPNAVSRRFVVDVPLAIGTNNLHVQARDRCGGLGEAGLVVLRPPNRAPTFDPTSLVPAREASPLTTTLHAADADGPLPVTYALDADSLARGATIDAASGLFRWVPGYDDAGIASFLVSASDGQETSTTRLTVVVENTNRPPRFVFVGGVPVGADTPEPQAWREQEARTLLVEAIDPDGGSVRYAVRGIAPEPVPRGLAVDVGRGELSWRPTFDDAGEHAVLLVATDAEGLEATLRLPLVVSNVNRPPEVRFPLRWSAREGVPLVAPLTALDADGDPLHWSLRNPPPTSEPVLLEAENGTFRWTPAFTESGAWSFTVVVSDGASIAIATFTVDVANVNRPPILERIDGVAVLRAGHDVPTREGASIAFDVEASDPDGDAVQLLLRPSPGERLPPGLELEANGHLTGTFGFGDGGVHRGEFVARDPEGAEDAVPVRFIVEETNRPPTLVVGPRAQVREGERLSWPFTATDPDADPLAITPGPVAGTAFPLALQLESGVAPALAWTPDFESAGTWAVALTLDDGRGGVASATVTIEVLDVNRPPVVAPVPTVRSYGHPGALTLDVSDPDGDTVTCTAVRIPALSRWDDTPRRLAWDELADGPDTARLDCSDGRDVTRVEIAFDVDWGVLVGGCECGGATASPLALLLLLARRRRRA